jgi:hypothetical protein
MLARRFNSIVKSFRVLPRPNTSHRSLAHRHSRIVAIPEYLDNCPCLHLHTTLFRGSSRMWSVAQGRIDQLKNR